MAIAARGRHPLHPVIASTWARSSCAIGSILATGYNGSIRGLPHCDEEGHLMEDGHCVRTVHAEANAIVQAARNGSRIEGAAIYVTASPCWGCFRLIANAGLVRIHFGEFYREATDLRAVGQAGDRAGRRDEEPAADRDRQRSPRRDVTDAERSRRAAERPRGVGRQRER